MRRGLILSTVGAALLLAAVLPVSATAGTRPTVDRDRSAKAQDSIPAIDLRVGLGRLLGEHAFLLMESMGANDAERRAYEEAIAENSGALQDAIASVYGDDAGARVRDLWDLHITLLLEYGDAAQSGDTGAMQTARDGLRQYMTDLGELLHELNPALDARQEARALQAHIDQITAFADGDYADAYASHRIAFSHMFQLGDHLALEIVRQHPAKFPDGPHAFSPRSDLQLALDHLLGEHLVLAAEAMRAGVRQSPALEAARESLDQNSGDLAGAIADVYGPDAGLRFEEVWKEHVDAYLAFVQALGSNDDAEREESLARLHAYHDQIAQLLTAVNPLLDGVAVADLIRRHVQALITQAEATAADDPARAIAATRDGYDGTFEVGEALAEAIARQFPNRFRDLENLPPTDSAGPVPKWASPSVWLVATLFVLIWVWIVLTGPTSRKESPDSRSAR
jgi:hypothetical protein